MTAYPHAIITVHEVGRAGVLVQQQRCGTHQRLLLLASAQQRCMSITRGSDVSLSPGGHRRIMWTQMHSELSQGLRCGRALSCCTWMFAACEVEPEASVEKLLVLRPAGRPSMKGEMSTHVTLRPSSARILQAAGSVATSSLPSPGT